MGTPAVYLEPPMLMHPQMEVAQMAVPPRAPQHMTLVVVRGIVAMVRVRVRPFHRVVGTRRTGRRVGTGGTATMRAIMVDAVVLVVGVVTGHILVVVVLGTVVDRPNIGVPTQWPTVVRHIFCRRG
tara:strand:+ start:64 stop:441 length:378 start_codon:yes stop_codon:yes gene_type:complete